MEESDFLALNVDQRKALQKELQAQKLYFGPIDGKSGDGMRAALNAQKSAQADQAKAAAAAEAQARADKLKEMEIENKRLELNINAGKQGAEDVLKTAAALRKANYDKDAQSGLGMATQSAASIAAPAVAGAAGLRFGQKVNDKLNSGQANRNKVLEGVAEDRIKGLTTREGARTGAKIAGAMPYENGLMRVLSRGGPQFGLGAISGVKGVQLLGDVNQEQPFYPRMADRAAGLGYLGFGVGLAKRGLEHMASPEVPPDARALAVINSNQLRRGNAIDEGPKLTPKQTLLAEARTAGVTGAGRMNMQQLTDALRKLPKTGVLGPLAAAGIAYGASPTDAQASPDGSSATGQDQALTNAGVAAGGTYGISRLMDALKGTGVGRALGAGGAMTVPMAAADAYDPTPERLAMDRNDLVRTLPSWMHVGKLGEAADMSKVPTPNPLRSEPGPGNQYYPLSSGQMPSQEPQQAATAPAPDQQGQSSLPSFGSLDELASAAEQDPELAAMIRELVTARLGQAQPQAQ